ncbi:hypothetical protein [Saccharopolyspora sp. NPDC002686]|uniref:hypothetical protein n=1 Tax=Saccharopolyspora sp. NPDC002686 TaxID=3154541 RepID=UPI003330FD82
MSVFPLALLMIFYDIWTIGTLWRKCDLVEAGGGFMLTFIVFPIAIVINLLLVPIGALVFAICRRVANRLVTEKQWTRGSAQGLMIPVGAGAVLALAVLASVLIVSGTNAQIPSDYPTTCYELGDGKFRGPQR